MSIRSETLAMANTNKTPGTQDVDTACGQTKSHRMISLRQPKHIFGGMHILA
jgi:hypothetical protein